jgi:hypothetical protein
MKLTPDLIHGFAGSILAKRYDGSTPTPQCHLEWWDLCCSENPLVAIAAPRAHGKSTAITHAYLLAALLFRDRRFVLIVSDTENQAINFLGDLTNELKNNGSIVYVGTPGEMTWSDFNDERGFHIYDTETRQLEFIKNPLQMFYKIQYNDDELFYNDLVNADYSHLTNKYVKIVVEKRNNSFLFDTLLDTLTKVNPLEVSVVEDFSHLNENVEVDVDQAEDTISILNKYVDGLTLPVESDKIKTVLRDVYNEAVSMETL